MSGNPQAVFTASLKGNVPDEPWLVVNAESVSDLLRLLAEVDTVVATAVSGAQANYRAGLALQAGGLNPTPVEPEPQNTSDWPPQRPEPQPTQLRDYQRTKPQAAVSYDGPNPPTDDKFNCAHGRRNRVGPLNGRRGQYIAYFCALPKGTPGSCAPIFEDA